MAEKQSPQSASKTSLSEAASLLTAQWSMNQSYATGWMGPLNPLPSVVPEQQRESVVGRQLDFMAGYNLRQRPRSEETVTFAQMRALADSCDVLRLVIETRKDEMGKLKLTIVPKDKEKKADKRCQEVLDFLALPDGENSWTDWLRQLLEELLVTDAACLYPLKSLSGDLLALELMDGTTIKRIINERGRTPRAPDPAYQQILKGVPTTMYTTEELIYRPRNKRVHKIYGYSPVEQIINTVNIAVRRGIHQLQYYTNGSTPDLLFQVPADWNLQQIKDFNDWWNDLLSGNTGQRRKAQFVPNGVNPVNTKEAILKDPYDEWLARVICYAFSVSPQWAIKDMNRATAETAVDQAKQEGLYPVMNWVVELINHVLRNHFGYVDLEAAWDQEEKSVSPADQAKIDDANLKNGSKKINEIRTSRGDDPVEGGDVLMVLTATGYVPAIPPDEPEPEPAPTVVAAPGALQVPQGAGQPPVDPAAKPAAEPNAKDGVTGKVAKRGAIQKMAAIKRERPTVVKARSALAKDLHKLFKQQLTEIVSENLVGKAAKDDTLADSLYAVLTKRLAVVSKDGVQAAATQINLVDQASSLVANENAINYANERAAELVGKRIDEDGNLIDNPNAEYSILDSTREMIRADVQQAMEEGWSNDDLASALSENYAFSDTRAETIARTETAKADVQGNLALYKASKVVDSKQWLTGEGCCEDCQELDKMVVGLDEDFDGNPDPPLHPNCRCDVLPILADEEPEPQEGEQ